MSLATPPLSDERSSKDYHHRIPLSALHELEPIDPQGWVIEPVDPRHKDPPKYVLDRLSVPEDGSLVQGLVAIRHLVPLVAKYSHVTHEYLGRVVMVSIRYPSGRVVHHRGEVHLRLFDRDDEAEWDEVRPISRNDLDYYRTLLFREPGSRGEYPEGKGVPPLVSPLDGRRVVPGMRKEMEEVGVPPNTPMSMAEVSPQKPVIRPRELPANDMNDEEEGAVKEKDEWDEVKIVKGRNVPADSPPKTDSSTTGSLANSNQGSSATSISEPRTPPDLSYPDNGADTPMGPVKTKDRMNLSSATYQSSIIVDPAKPDPTKPIRIGRPANGAPHTTVPSVDSLKVELMKEARIVTGGEETKTFYQLKAEKEEKLMEAMEKGLLRRNVDKDGDVLMEGGESAPAPQPAAKPQGQAHPTSDPRSMVEELNKKLRLVQGQVLSLQWKRVDYENLLEERMNVMESRIAVLEANRVEEVGSTLPPRRRSTREPQDRPLTRGVTHRLESRIDTLAKELTGIRKQMEAMERVEDEREAPRRDGEKLVRRVAGLERLAVEGEKKLSGFETKLAEERLRQEIIVRELTQGKKTVSSEVIPRISKLEARIQNVDYRLLTTESQMVWTDHKLRLLWFIVAAPGPNEAYNLSTQLRTVWEAAASSYRRRIVEGPASPAIPQSFCARDDPNAIPENRIPVPREIATSRPTPVTASF